MNLQAEPPSLDWLVTTDSTSFDVISNIMTGLTQYTNSLDAAPACASSWDVGENGTKYVFHLRKDVYWTDGKPVTAPDFEYAWKRLLDPGTAAQYAFFLYDLKNGFEFNSGKVKDPDRVGVKAVDDYTLEVKLKRPAAYFIYLTAFCPTYPQRRDVVERFGDRWTEPDHIVTNGPFKLSSWKHEYKIDLDSNPAYFEGEPRLKKIKLFMIPEQATAFGLFENNQLDYVDNRSFPTADVKLYADSPLYRNIALLRGTYLGFNVKKPPFDDARVRRAVSMAMDREMFPRILRRGERPAFNWIPPQLSGYSPDSAVKHNLSEAKRLLSEAGYPAGKGFPRVKLLYPQREDAKLVVEAVQEQLKRNLNIPVELEVNEWKVYLSTLERDPPHIFRGSWGADYPDPETFMNLFTTHNGNNNTRWADAKYDRLVDRAAGEPDTARRAKLYAEADAYLSRIEAPIAPLYFATQNLMVKPWVKNMEFNALDVQFFKDVYISPDR